MCIEYRYIIKRHASLISHASPDDAKANFQNFSPPINEVQGRAGADTDNFFKWGRLKKSP